MSIRSFDVFKKVNQDIDTSTATGGIYSIIAIIAGIILFISEYTEYSRVNIKSFMTISQTDNDLVKTNIDITVLGSPCHMLALDLQDDVGSHIADYTETLEKIRIVNGVEVREQLGANQNGYRHSDQEYKEVLEAINNKEYCRFQGNLFLKKVPGNFHISYHSKMDLLNKMRVQNQAEFRMLNLNYVINSLSFGQEQQFITSLFIFGYGSANSQPYNGMRFESEGKHDYDNYLKILPVQYHINKQGIHTNQYKFAMYNSQIERNDLDDTPAITFKYEVSPINIVYNLHKQSFYHFLVQICAIVGGIFSVIGIFNSLTTGVIQKLKN